MDGFLQAKKVAKIFHHIFFLFSRFDELMLKKRKKKLNMELCCFTLH